MMFLLLASRLSGMNVCDFFVTHTVEGKYPKLNCSHCLFLVGTKLSLFKVFRLGFEILECGQLTEQQLQITKWLQQFSSELAVR